ncbi:DUF4240 domain-containing protein [Chryseolinea sp. T2]|uniref:DUF4240 domain-containing protein n=1 Tax=Chryseolinea sp. T2 TaxID=3129255 RepID=UPI003077A8CA
MGLFDKLFGGKGEEDKKPSKPKDFIASTTPMDEEQFWRIIQRTKDQSLDDFEQQQEVLSQELGKLTPEEIIKFDNRFRSFRGEANTWKLWGAIYIIHGGCGDDSFGDFREWVIGQGQDFYYKTIKDPETLIDVEVGEEWEGLGYVAPTVFGELTGAEMPRPYEENFEPTGKQWQEDGDDLKNLFPKLYAKYN